MKIQFGGHDFILHHAGVLLWPAQNMLIASDLHLEKSSFFARRGFFLPPYDSRETLDRLLDILQQAQMRRILILGDCFHDQKGYARLDTQSCRMFDQLRQYDPVWIQGNHDGDFIPDGMTGHDSWECGGIAFRHEAIPGAAPEISGHFHPGATIAHKGGLISRPCFIDDGRKMILPAFGSYTGSLNISDPAIANHFPRGCKAYALGTERVHLVINKIH